MWTSAHAIVTYVVVGIGVLSAVHALLYKRDPRSQLGWVVACLVIPLLGWVAYWLLGVNRIKTKAQRWQARGRWGADTSAERLTSVDPVRAEVMGSLLHLSRAVTARPLLAGNKVEPLHNGEQAYPAMLEAIAGAKHTVHLCTYIFETGRTGRRFVDALAAAAQRGVTVRVLVDAIGEHYARPRVSKLLARHPKVKVGRFLPLLARRGLSINLRNHRKVLVVDGVTGFTGGMNIGHRHMVEAPDNRNPTVDVHFLVEGPAAAFLEESFAGDWYFATGEDTGWAGYQDLPARGTALCRGITDGPNEDLEKLQLSGMLKPVNVQRKRKQKPPPWFLRLSLLVTCSP